MGVRAVAAALAVWCVSGVAVAAGYAEVWNPPEASRHTAKQAKKKTVAAKTGAKTGATHAASGQHHATVRVASASGKGGKPAVHGGKVKKVAGKGGVKAGSVGTPGVAKPRSKPAVMTQGKNPRVQIVGAKPGQGKVIHANLVQRAAQGQKSHPQAVRSAAKTGAATPSMSRATTSAPSANVSVSADNPATNPATASSGSLPPIIH
ncbi:hypothetical protein [Paraburkholderia sp. BCC1884]|uniref:hypothetical protein n=1 Tax=Paraburkholderia sp. BCC1884 TaxID=2562668 RepID=UPI001183E68A|nr:hypothetical protein [Paraburkholderia sp. BCC1884]